MGIAFTWFKNWAPVEPDLIKHIMQTDFPHFVNRGTFVDEENDPLTGHLAALEGSKWKNMRTKLTPTFTSGKMKMMFQALADCTVGLKEVLNEYATSKTSVDIKDILGRFTTDIIGSAAFGLECNSLKNPDAEFRKYGKRMFEADTWQSLKLTLQFAVPHGILRWLKMKITPSDVETFFMKAVKDTVDYREKNNVYRKDFMHLLLQLKNRGRISDDDKISDETGEGEKALTMNELSAQAFVFFAAGFETSSTTMTFAFLELALNPPIQDKLRKEINEVLAKHEDKFTYDPERFSEDNKKTRPANSFLPFGEGPRICIGMRFGLMQSKVGIAAILKNYKISLGEKTQLPIVFEKHSFITSVQGGVWIDVEKIN